MRAWYVSASISPDSRCRTMRASSFRARHRHRLALVSDGNGSDSRAVGSGAVCLRRGRCPRMTAAIVAATNVSSSTTPISIAAQSALVSCPYPEVTALTSLADLRRPAGPAYPHPLSRAIPVGGRDLSHRRRGKRSLPPVLAYNDSGGCHGARRQEVVAMNDFSPRRQPVSALTHREHDPRRRERKLW